jgi:hypothetical protein
MTMPKQTARDSIVPSNTLPRLFLWLLGAILMTTEVVLFAFFDKPVNHPASTQIPRKIPTSMPATLTPTDIPTKTSTSTPVNCILWSSLTRHDAGKSRCIFGRITKIYATDQYIEIIRFSAQAGTFLIWDREKYIELSVGQCISAKGIIHQDASELYMEISGTKIHDYSGCP